MPLSAQVKPIPAVSPPNVLGLVQAHPVKGLRSMQLAERWPAQKADIVLAWRLSASEVRRDP